MGWIIGNMLYPQAVKPNDSDSHYGLLIDYDSRSEAYHFLFLFCLMALNPLPREFPQQSSLYFDDSDTPWMLWA